VKADVYKQGAERTAAIANCLNTVLIAIGCCVYRSAGCCIDGLLKQLELKMMCVMN
jgi:hypothetical protein